MPNTKDEYLAAQKLISSLEELSLFITQLSQDFGAETIEEPKIQDSIKGYWQQFITGICKDGEKHGSVAGLSILTAASVSLLNAAGLPVALGSVTSLALVFGQERAERIIKTGLAFINGEENKGTIKLPEPSERLILSRRQRECLTLAAEGKSTKEICAALDLSETTVNNHIRLATYKLGTTSRTKAIEIASDNDLIVRP